MEEQKVQNKEGLSIFFIGILGSVLSIAGLKVSGMYFILLLMPLPYIHLIKKYGHRSGTLAILLTAFINSIFLGIMGMVFTLVGFGLTAVLVGGAFYEKFKPSRIVLISILAAVITGFIYYFLGQQFGLVGKFRQTLDNPIFWDNLAKSGVTIESKKEFLNGLIALLPGVIFSGSLVLGLFNYYLSAAWLKRQGFEVEKLLPIKEWGFTRWIGFGYILMEIMPADSVSVNISMALLSILVVQGIAFTVYFSDKWGVYPWVRNIIIVIGFIFLWFVFFILGLVDNIFRLRGIPKKVKIEEDEGDDGIL